MAQRLAYEAQFKLKAISYAEEHGNRAAAREFQINESMVRKWRMLGNELRQVKKTQLSFRGHKVRWPDLEERLKQWIIDQRTSGRSVSTVTIRLKAAMLAEEMKIEHFRGDRSWCFRFMKRCHSSTRTRTTVVQQRPADYNEKLANFRSYCSKRIAVIDCKGVRRQRSRPGPKKKILPLPQTPEEMYRLTCRFCDLVFQGPLSVQEDWIKHLQRHIMNTSVPHTGLGMVEVTTLPTDSQAPKTDLDSSLTATHAAS